MENTYTLGAICHRDSTPIVIWSLSLGSIGRTEVWEGKKWNIKLFWNTFFYATVLCLYFSTELYHWLGPKVLRDIIYPKNLVFLDAIASLTPRQLGRKMNELTSSFLVFVLLRCWFKTLIFFHLEKETGVMQFFSFPKIYSVCSNWSFCHKCFYFIHTYIYSLRTTGEKWQIVLKVQEVQQIYSKIFQCSHSSSVLHSSSVIHSLLHLECFHH